MSLIYKWLSQPAASPQPAPPGTGYRTRIFLLLLQVPPAVPALPLVEMQLTSYRLLSMASLCSISLGLPQQTTSNWHLETTDIRCLIIIRLWGGPRYLQSLGENSELLVLPTTLTFLSTQWWNSDACSPSPSLRGILWPFIQQLRPLWGGMNLSQGLHVRCLHSDSQQ